MNRFSITAGFLPCKDRLRAQQHDGLSDPEKPISLLLLISILVQEAGLMKAQDRSIQMKLARVPLAVYALSFLGFLSGAGFIKEG